MQCLSAHQWTWRITTKGRLPSSQTIPFDHFILSKGFQVLPFLLTISLGFGFFHLLARNRDASDQSCGAANCVSLGFCLGLFLFTNLANLVEITLEHG